MASPVQILEFLHKKSGAGIGCELLLVSESSGSSPGRAGFAMGVSADGELCGSIGGGAMEHKLVERSRKNSQNKMATYHLSRQNHNSSGEDRSGMICSGQQLVLCCTIGKEEHNILGKLLADRQQSSLLFGPEGMQLAKGLAATGHAFQFKNATNWNFKWSPAFRSTVHIIGGGHVSLALSSLLSSLGFRVCVYDQRQQLNTVAENRFAETIEVNFSEFAKQFTAAPADLVILSNFSYKEDRQILKQLAGKRFAYWGMIGSQNKVGRLMKELRKELQEAGTATTYLDEISAPMGLPIHSHSPMEIAVSVAAEIIQRRNAPQK